MKKLITSILVAICAVGLSLSANAQSTAVLTAVCPEDAVSGSEFTVDFVLSENSGAAGGKFDIVYDTESLEFVKTENKEVLDSVTPTVNEDYADGTIRVIWAGTKGNTGGGTVITVTFFAKISYEDREETVEIKNLKLADESTAVIASASENAVFTVKAEPKPVMTVKSASTAVIGDKIGISVMLSEKSRACGGGFCLIYDNSAFTYSSYEPGELVSGCFNVVNSSYKDNMIKFTWAGAGAQMNGGCLVTILFDVADTSKEEACFTLGDARVADEDTKKTDCEIKGRIVNFSKDSDVKITASLDAEGKATNTVIYNCPEKAKLYTALYKGDALLNVIVEEIGSDNRVQTEIPSVDFETLRVMLWTDSDTITPLCAASDAK